MSDNGHNPPILLPGAAPVPIVGQPWTLKSWFVTIQVVCNCAAGEPLLIVGRIGTGVPCPTCRRVHVLRGLAYDLESQQMLISVQTVPGHEASGKEPDA